MKKIKRIISKFLMLGVIGCLTLVVSVGNAYAGEVSDVKYRTNSKGELVIEDGEYTTIIGEPITEVEGLKGEDAVKALQSQSVDPRLSFGVANAVQFNVRYENPVSKTYPVSVYQGTVKMYSCSAKITLKVSATSDSNKSIKSTISTSNWVKNANYAPIHSTSNSGSVSKIGANTYSSLTVRVTPAGGRTKTFIYTCNNKTLSNLASNTQVGPGYRMQQYWSLIEM